MFPWLERCAAAAVCHGIRLAALDRYARVAVALGANGHQSREDLAQAAIDIVNGYNDKFGVCCSENQVCFAMWQLSVRLFLKW